MGGLRGRLRGAVLGHRGIRAGCAPSVDARPVQAAWWAKYMRATATPRAIAAQTRAAGRTNMNFVLPSLQMPTLVMHRTQIGSLTLQSARALTRSNSWREKFLEIPGADVMPTDLKRGYILNVSEEFVTGVRPSQPPTDYQATVLFTDIVDSTRLATSARGRRLACTSRRARPDGQIRAEAFSGSGYRDDGRRLSCHVRRDRAGRFSVARQSARVLGISTSRSGWAFTPVKLKLVAGHRWNLSTHRGPRSSESRSR